MSPSLLSAEDLLKQQIELLTLSIQEYSDRRDYLVGRVVAIETKGMNYTEQKAYSLGMRWYFCKDKFRFLDGYREESGVRW